MNDDELRAAWDHFLALPRPEWPQVDVRDELGDLIADLILPETFIAGMAMTALGGGEPDAGVDTDLHVFHERLAALDVPDDDRPSYLSTKVWLDALQGVVDALDVSHE